MAGERDDMLGGSPKDPVTDTIVPRDGPMEKPGTEAEEAAGGDRGPVKPRPGEMPAGQGNAAYRGDAPKEPPREASGQGSSGQGSDGGPGHDTEEAAAYRENDA